MLWIYHQIQEWKGEYVLDPFKWGWQLTKRGVIPIEMIIQAVPPELLKIVKHGFKTDCTRKNCICRQYGYRQNVTFAPVAGECPGCIAKQ